MYDIPQIIGNFIRQVLRPTFCCFSDLGWPRALLLMRRQRKKLVWLGLHQTPSQIRSQTPSQIRSQTPSQILWKKTKGRQGQLGQKESIFSRLPACQACIPLNCLLQWQMTVSWFHRSCGNDPFFSPSQVFANLSWHPISIKWPVQRAGSAQGIFDNKLYVTSAEYGYAF